MGKITLFIAETGIHLRCRPNLYTFGEYIKFFVIFAKDCLLTRRI